jgi:hypothetical protein
MLLLIQDMYNRAVLSGDWRLARDLEMRWLRLLKHPALRDRSGGRPIPEKRVAAAA